MFSVVEIDQFSLLSCLYLKPHYVMIDGKNVCSSHKGILFHGFKTATIMLLQNSSLVFLCLFIEDTGTCLISWMFL